MRFEALASSSHGNAYIVSDRDTRILLECGISKRKLQQLCGFKVTGFDACLVSHEHKDHSQCAKDLITAGIPVYMSEGTADALELENVELVEEGKIFEVGTLTVLPFGTFHDALEPMGFLIRSRVDGESLLFATDLVRMRHYAPEATILAIEANYDKYILERCEKMPEKVKHRIANSHMEIDSLCDYLRSADLRRCREVYLLHLSDATSHEWHFINKVFRAVPRGVKVTACPR